MGLLETVGWVGSALVVASLTQGRVLRFRMLNLVGACSPRDTTRCSASGRSSR